MKPIISVSGSLAYDTVLHTNTSFGSTINPELINNLNVAFGLHNVEQFMGGTAGNITYNLRLLHNEVRLHSVLGFDGVDYLKKLEMQKIPTEDILLLDGHPTAHAYVLTDLYHNQITGFNGGALNHGELLFNTAENVSWAIISPDSVSHMLQASVFWHQNNVPYVFDPGQSLTILPKLAAYDLIKNATLIIVNTYEHDLLKKLLDEAWEDLSVEKKLITTKGSQGVRASIFDKVIEIPVGTAKAVVDPTGCGDAFRGGLLHGLARNWKYADALALGSTMGAIKVASPGGQGHTPTLEEIKEAYEHDFGPWPEK